jgi:hypothetical protein
VVGDGDGDGDGENIEQKKRATNGCSFLCVLHQQPFNYR